ncbi:hypothetical protein D3C78_1309900 [compost metagenome]
MQSRLSTMGLMAQLAAQEAPMGPGVVQGVRETTRSTRPRSRANQARVALIIGTRMKGRKKTGFMTMGAPNRIGSLMLNRPGTTPILPMDLRCAALLRSSRKASGRVEPTPPISR